MIIYTCLAAVVLLSMIYTGVSRRKRLRQTNTPPPHYQPTEEVFVDPTTGIKQRVWYNPATGERHYQALPPDL